ncbi:hypothetical protein TWF281_004171 [Arthrobotrys megalospora]
MLLNKASRDLKKFTEETPLFQGIPAPPGSDDQSIYDIIRELVVGFEELVLIVKEFEDNITVEHHQADPDIGMKHATALNGVQTVRRFFTRMPEFSVDAPVDFWKLTPLQKGSPDRIIWKVLENIIAPSNPDITDNTLSIMAWLGYTFEPKAAGDSGTWHINPDKATLRLRVLDLVQKGISELANSWYEPMGKFAMGIHETPIEKAIPLEFQDNLIGVLDTKFTPKLSRLENDVRKLKQYYMEFNKDVTALIDALPEGWDRDD